MNKQKIFTRVRRHLLKQNKQSLNSDGNCAYRGENGLKCAIGCLIPNTRYMPELEGKTADCLPGGLIPGVKSKEDDNFLLELQEIHDNQKPEHWRWSFKILAKRHNLKLEKV